jgi:serine O-acetyltransferase
MDINCFTQGVSASEPDWSRESVRYFWDPGRKLLRSIRRYQALQNENSFTAKIVQKYWMINHWFWSLITQSEIHLNCEIEGGLLLPHPTGIIIHYKSRIGPNCLIFHHVTLAGPVELGGHCDIGAGAKLIGPLHVGQHVQVGANAVVTRDVPDRSIVAGVPARIIASLPSETELQKQGQKVAEN